MIRRSIRSFLPKLTSTVAVAALILDAADGVAAEAARNFDIRAPELSRALLAFSVETPDAAGDRSGGEGHHRQR